MNSKFTFILVALSCFLFENTVHSQVLPNPYRHFNEPHADYQSKLDFYKRFAENRLSDLPRTYPSGFPEIQQSNPHKQSQASSALTKKSHAMSMIGKKKATLRGGGESRLDSTYVFFPWAGDEPIEVIYYTYDEEEGLLMSALTVDQGGWLVGQILYEYDDFNRLETETQHLFYNGQGWDIKIKLDYGYSTAFPQADTITESFVDWQTSNWRVSLKHIFQLDAQGLPVQKEQFWVGAQGELELNSRTLFVYDDEFILIEEIEQSTCFGLSDVWTNFIKTTYLHDMEGRLTEQEQFYWDVDHWETKYGTRILYSYDEADNLVLEEEFYAMLSGAYSWATPDQDSIVYASSVDNVQLYQSRWGSQQEAWQLNTKVDSFFNSRNQVEEVIRQFACADTLVNAVKETFAYNSENELIEWVTYYWNGVDQIWDENRKTDYTYDNNGQLEIETEQYWNDDLADWENRFRRLFSYDSLNLLSEAILEKYEDENWRNEGRTQFAYDSLSQLVEETHAWWPTWSMEWESYLQITYTYDGNGQLIEETQNGWACNPNCFWMPYELRTYTYNDQGQQILSEYSYWEYNSNDWLPTERICTSYDPVTTKAIERIYKRYQQSSFTWEESRTYQHFWSPLISSILDIEQPELDCRMANPYRAGNLIFCDGWPLDESGKIYLYDMLGRLRLEQDFSQNTRLYQELEIGTYLMSIKGESGKMFNRKIIVH